MADIIVRKLIVSIERKVGESQLQVDCWVSDLNITITAFTQEEHTLSGALRVAADMVSDLAGPITNG